MDDYPFYSGSLHFSLQVTSGPPSVTVSTFIGTEPEDPVPPKVVPGERWTERCQEGRRNHYTEEVNKWIQDPTSPFKWDFVCDTLDVKNFFSTEESMPMVPFLVPDTPINSCRSTVVLCSKSPRPHSLPLPTYQDILERSGNSDTRKNIKLLNLFRNDDNDPH